VLKSVSKYILVVDIFNKSDKKTAELASTLFKKENSVLNKRRKAIKNISPKIPAIGHNVE
jgi:hypothetical protein